MNYSKVVIRIEKSKSIKCRVTPEEKMYFKNLAVSKNLNESDLARAMLFNTEKNDALLNFIDKVIQNDDVKSISAHTRFSKEEYDEVISKTKIAKLTLSKYLRLVAIGHEIIVIDGLKEMAYELNKIGQNLNQIVVLAHQGKVQTIDLSRMREDLTNLWRGLDMLRKEAVKAKRTRMEKGKVRQLKQQLD